ncbi:MAG: hypothetical protein ACJ786_00060, partial [Catenulispora sp.]
MASAAVGIVACSAPGKAREPAGAAQPMSAPAPRDTVGRVQVQVPPATVVAHVPVARSAGGQNPPSSDIRRAPDAAPEAVAGPAPDAVAGPAPAGVGADIAAPAGGAGAGAAVAAPVAAPPSGTTLF